MLKDFKDLRIVFMGTPDFAVASLDALVQAGGNIVGVVTAPDKPAGRGMQLQQSAVKKYAVAHNLLVLQPEKLKNEAFIESLKNLNADVQAVVAFRMLPEVVWNMPPMGTINVHGSLLPQYRGAAPINWAVINGEAFTGVTTFKLQHEIDTGDILLSEKISIKENDTAGNIHDQLMHIGAQLLVKTLQGLASNSIVEVPQSSIEGPLQHAPKIFTSTCQIDWNKTNDEVYNLIRGLAPYPTAFTHLNGKTLKINEAIKVDEKPTIAIGDYKTDEKNYLYFATATGYISVTQLQLEGKKRMDVKEFLRGYRFNK
ncbi:methionyl-tRNA formyltransferase [Ferruginibacter yonginensis]|uniref:Methionyl-tRNA formyltransferase n=1 Tax=Ferruginibacter yonginensis TaxID=1310416 RepID=A0ABV8QXI4_9BACT